MGIRDKKKRVQQRITPPTTQGVNPLEEAQTDPKKVIGVAVGLALLVVVCYVQVHSFGFVNYDDPLYITDNERTQAGLSFDNVIWAFTTGEASNWHPLTWLSLMLDVTLFGAENPGPLHVENVLFHIANTLLLFLVLWRMTRSTSKNWDSLWPSALVAALFAIHPLHVESVAWIAERKDVLSTLFWILTMAGYAWYCRRPSLGRYIVVVIPFALGLMTKPMLVTLPIILLLLDVWPLGRWRIESGAVRKAVTLTMEKTPLFALAGISSLVTIWAQRAGKSMAGLEALPVPLRIENALVAYTKYLIMMIWPSGLAPFYPHPGPSLPIWQAAASLLFLGVCTGLVLWQMRLRPYLFTGLFWYLFSLLPVIGVIQVGAQSMADRYTYVPLIGVFIMGAWAANDVVARKPEVKWVAGAIAAVVLIACAGITMRQVSYWRNSQTLFEHTLRVTTGNYLAHKNLGVEFANQKKYQEAAREYLDAIRIKSNDADLYYNLANAYGEMNKQVEAIEAYRKALKIDPEHSESFYNLANALARAGSLDEALQWYGKLLERQPDHVGAHVNMGNTLAMLKRFEEAATQYQEAIRLDPKGEDAYVNLGNVLGELKRPEEAVKYYQEAIRLRPGNPNARANLGYAFGTLGRWQEAVAALEEALRLDPSNAVARQKLSAAKQMIKQAGTSTP